MKNLFVSLGILSVLTVSVLAEVTDRAPFDFNDSTSIGNNSAVYEYYYPEKVTPLMKRLPEFSKTGPGYICELRQPAPVYRFPVQGNRINGYREADWSNNMLYNNTSAPVNFGGYTH